MEIVDIANIISEFKADINKRLDNIDKKLDEKVNDKTCSERMNASRVVITNKQITAIISAVATIAVALVATFK